MQAASVVGFATLLSRILGFVRDAAIAWYFGAGFASDAFIAAFRLPNLFRRLLGEGAFSSAVVPVLTEIHYTQGREESNRLAGAALRLLALLLCLLAVVCIVLAPWLVRCIAPGFVADKYQLTVVLARIMLPYLFFVCLVALCAGILNVYNHFAAPAYAPVMLNLGMIGAVFLIAPKMETPIVGLAIGVILGGFLQLALQVPFLVRQRVFFWRDASLFHPAMKHIGRLLMPVVLGGAVYQINILVSTLLGTLLTEGSVTFLYFADRLVQFPLGIFAIAATTAVLPSLSRQAAAQDWTALKETLGQAFRMIFFLTVPAMVGLILLREPIVALLFERGEFDATATRLTAGALSYYASGLWAFATVRIVATSFFCAPGYQNASDRCRGIHYRQYCHRSNSDAVHVTQRSGPGNINCLHVEPCDSGCRNPFQIGRAPLEKASTVNGPNDIHFRPDGCFRPGHFRSGVGAFQRLDCLESIRTDSGGFCRSCFLPWDVLAPEQPGTVRSGG